MTYENYLVPLVGLIGSLIGIFIGYLLTRSRERESEWRKEKLKFYVDFIKSISDITEDTITKEKSDDFAKRCNNFYLFSPKNIIKALQDYREETSINNKNFSYKQAEIKLKRLITLIRKDLKIKYSNLNTIPLIIYVGLKDSKK